MIRRLLICLAFATWCFLDTWVEYAEGGVTYFARWNPLRAVVIPVLCLEAVITLALFVSWEFLRGKRLDRSTPIHFLFLALCFAPLGIASVAALRILPSSAIPLVRSPLFWPVALIASSPPIALACWRPRSASRLFREVLLSSWPVLLILFVQAARHTLLTSPNSGYADGPLAVPLQSPPADARVVWIVFDEASQAITFGNRPRGLELPNLDRLKNSSFYATSAIPAGDATKFSIPSLILGERVIDVNPKNPNELDVRLASHLEMQPFSAALNVFDAARKLGFNSAVDGWYFPYGRTLNHSLTKCYWTAAWLRPGVEERIDQQPLARAMWDRARFQFIALPLIGHLPRINPGSYEREEKIERFSRLRDHALDLAADPAIGLVLIHLPVPHPPAIYSRTLNRYTALDRAGYLDNLALADRTLGELRHTLEQSGLWDRTAVLVSADHGWRIHLWRGDAEWTPDEEAASHQDTSGVPFLLKLPNQTSGLIYAKPFNTIVTRAVITAILSGRLKDPNSIAELIERH